MDRPTDMVDSGPNSRRSSEFPAVLLAIPCTALLVVACLLSPGTARLQLLLWLCGVGPALFVRRDWRFSELVFCLPVFSLILFSLSSFIGWRFGVHGLVAGLPVVASAILATIFALRGKRISISHGASDYWCVGLVALVAVAIGLVASCNGFQSVGGTTSFIARGWYKADSCYLFSLVQMAVERRGWPAENPMLSAIANYYPSLIHVGLAGLTLQSGAIAAAAVPSMFGPIVISGVALYYHSCDRMAAREKSWIPALGTLLVLVARPDFFLFPQTQCFALPVLFLVLTLIAGNKACGPFCLLSGLGVFIVFAHTVTALVVLVVLIVSAVLVIPARDRNALRRFGPALAGFLLALLFLSKNAMPVKPDWGSPFSGISLSEVSLVLMPWVLPLATFVAMVCFCWRRYPAFAGAAALTTAVGVAYFARGCLLVDHFDAWFDTFNAQRLFFLGLVIILPGLCAIEPRKAMACMGVALLGFVAVPSNTTLGCLNLISEKPLVLGPQFLSACEYVRQQTAPTSRIVTNAENNAVPALTGRARFANEKENYWGHGSLPERANLERVNQQTRYLSDLASWDLIKYDPTDFLRTNQISAILIDRRNKKFPTIDPLKIAASDKVRITDFGDYMVIETGVHSPTPDLKR
ncbi:MAG: hypothetical protein K1X53_12450 [Candidatus Sumerlaeaceae bacterium]|nr:hypothetical protein [Candidatus Sumerlaeaceae bacterium]